MPANLLHALPDARSAECFDDLLKAPGCRVERIVSHGQSSPPDFWYDQNWDEWVLLLAGHAVLKLESRSEPVPLQPGDYLLIPANEKHRVESTAPDQPTVWLALHFDPQEIQP